MKKSIVTTILFLTIFLSINISLGEDLVIDQSGNVGIGTTEPQDLLHIYKPGYNWRDFIIESGQPSLRFVDNEASQTSFGFGADGNVFYLSSYAYADRFATGRGTPIMTVYGGNVGIGTTSPAGNLHIYNSSGTADLILDSYDNNNDDIIHFRRAGITTDTARIAVQNNDGSAQQNSMKFYTGLNEATPKMIISSAGNVGIGTTSPDGTLHVNSGSAGTWVPYSLTDDLVVEGSTHTGISIASPDTASQFISFSSPSRTGLSNSTLEANWNSGNPYLRLGTSGFATTLNIQSGNVGIGKTNPSEKLDVNGNIKCNNLISNDQTVTFSTIHGQIVNVAQITVDDAVKTFVIDHPIDESKYLVHATLEGPEAGVYYRGTAQLVNGEAEIELPHYFEALTRQEGRTIMLTNIDGFDRLMVKRIDGQKIKNGRFLVVADNAQSTQEFDWEVKAIRKDVPHLDVEPDKDDLIVRGNGPYTYGIPKAGVRD
jgi:hypothetical protein